MNPVRLIKTAIAAIKDPERNFTERVFLILAFATEVAMLIGLEGDLIMKEDSVEMVVIGVILVVLPIAVFTGLRYNKLGIMIKLMVLAVSFTVFPILYFFGGGLQGGGVLWMIFAFMYVGLLLSGRWRSIMITLLTLLTLSCYLLSYYYPGLVKPHSREMFYVDSCISIVLVGALCFAVTAAQGRLFAKENERAKKEAMRAEELTKAQNRFFSNMSHEIRTPINSILGLNELILRDEYATDDIIKDASGIQGSGKMLLTLINDILDFSKIEAGSMDIVPVDYSIGDLLSEIVNMMWLRAHDKGLDFDVSVDPEVPTVLYGDEVRIKQVIINLLNNAVKYTKEGRVELRVESRDTDDDSIELTVSVSDTGMGIRKEDLPYLFDAFKRVDEGRNRHIEGTGLGLSIVKQLVELMGGSITVNSIYGEGSTFTFLIKQGVSDRSRVGELNIHNQQTVKRNAYECSFFAPEARILIVDDNEMNLEVESRLLEDTDMVIDKALNGKQALEMTLKAHYDAIFMDHLMPQMDGIECLEQLRNQPGGLNRSTPVIILTANAGSENRELYTRSGFDGYLVKPVSGEAMEETLIRHISSEKIILRSMMMGDNEEIHTSDKYSEKIPVIITSSSTCDLPDYVLRKLNIPVIPSLIHTEDGIFKDGVHMDANELVRYLDAGGEAVSSHPDEQAYTDFFAGVLKKAHHLIHISITTSVSRDYYAACEAAKAFDNVTVINSECLSGATGILVLIAIKLAGQGLQVKDIVSELESIKRRLSCSFIIDTTGFMAKKGLISRRLNRIAYALNLHPALRIRNDKAVIDGMWMGRTKSAYRRYIKKALPPDYVPDPDVVFVTYVDIPSDILSWIEEEIKKAANFEHVIFTQASASISLNCGSGTFGIMYFLKSDKSYNVASLLGYTAASAKLPDEEDTAAGQEAEGEAAGDAAYGEAEEPGTFGYEADDEAAASGKKWYEGIEGIDADTAIKNSGSEELFRDVLKVFYDSISDKYEELEGYYTAENWDDYTIKIHSLKSSARLIGAMELGRGAELLESAGKKDDAAYIKEHHLFVMEDYLKYREKLALVFEGEDSEKNEKPEADDTVIKKAYERLKEAAAAMDCDEVEEAVEELKKCSIPDAEKDRFERICDRADQLDYDGILEALKES